jgi:flagellar motor switch protein FliN/FliY
MPANQVQDMLEVSANPPNIALLVDVEMEATLRFGTNKMILRSILDLNAGKIVELERHIHEPAELLVGGKVIARGEVMIVDGCYGLRITEVGSEPLQEKS